MSTGDLLFIFAFIVLPTIILVSCIWTLLLIRAGVLLPARRSVVDDTEALVEGDDPEPAELVETTAVHEIPAQASEAEPVVIDVVEAPAAATALPAPEPLPAIEAEPAIEPVIADVTPSEEQPELTPDDEQADEFEQTTEFTIIDDAMLESEAAELPASEAEPPAPAASDQPAEEPIPAPEVRPDEPARAPTPDLDVLFVPLPDEPAAATSNGMYEPDIVAEVEDDIAEEEPDDRTTPRHGGRSRRKSVRRVAQLRPSEEQSPNVSPMGNLLRRTRSGNSR